MASRHCSTSLSVAPAGCKWAKDSLVRICPIQREYLRGNARWASAAERRQAARVLLGRVKLERNRWRNRNFSASSFTLKRSEKSPTATRSNSPTLLVYLTVYACFSYVFVQKLNVTRKGFAPIFSYLIAVFSHLVTGLLCLLVLLEWF